MKLSSLKGARPYIAGVVLALAATATLTAVAHGGPRGGHGPGPAMMFSSPERLDRMLDRMLDGVDATDEQRTRIRKIAHDAMDDLKGRQDAGRGMREKALSLFTQPTVDADAVEAARQEMLKRHDARTLRISQAMVDASRVLTPEQRAKLAERIKQRGEMRHRRGQERPSQGDEPRR